MDNYNNACSITDKSFTIHSYNNNISNPASHEGNMTFISTRCVFAINISRRQSLRDILMANTHQVLIKVILPKLRAG